MEDFPDEVLGPLVLEVIAVDDFLLGQLDLSEASTLAVIQEQAAAMRRPPVELADLLARMGRSGAPGFAAAVQALLAGDAVTPSA